MNILIVDETDIAPIRTITSQTLKAYGYRVLTAANGALAMARYVEDQAKIAVVLTDMAMPIMPGPAMIHALLRINPEVKIIAASGLSAGDGSFVVTGTGVKHFIAKPYTAETLLKTLRSVLDEK